MNDRAQKQLGRRLVFIAVPSANGQLRAASCELRITTEEMGMEMEMEVGWIPSLMSRPRYGHGGHFKALDRL